MNDILGKTGIYQPVSKSESERKTKRLINSIMGNVYHFDHMKLLSPHININNKCIYL